jgi:hypothetical protein
MNIPTRFLASYAPGGKAYHVENPAWRTVEEVLEQTFATGGAVELSWGFAVYEPVKGTRPLNSIHMQGLPGTFRVQLLLRRQEKGPSMREWWEPGDQPFRGGKRINDDDWDLRTFCSDVEVAKSLFQGVF